MRTHFSAWAALGLAAAIGAARADEPPRTVADYFGALDASASRLDAEVTERQRLGDMAAAQRLILAAAMVRRTAAEFHGAEQAVMTEAVSTLPAPIPQRVEDALAKAAEAEAGAADRADFVTQAHLTFNALLAALPQRTPHPVIYGLLSDDLAGEGAPLGHDVVIYGFRLIDPLSKALPQVIHGDTELGAADVAISDDRIDVTLPESVKRAIGFAPSPCERRPSFGLRVRATYWELHGIWPIRWNSEVLTNADLYALPTPSVFSAAVTASAETTLATNRTVSFRQKSSLAVADCGQTQTTQAVATLPEGAHEATCSATWVDVSGAARLDARCAVEGHAARGDGEIAAAGRICSPENLCTCLSKAQGWLVASGSYRIDEPAHQIRPVGGQPPLVFPAGGVAQGRLALEEGQRLRHVVVSIARRACPTPVDSLELTPSEGPDAEASGVSKTGAFRAILKGAQLSVGAAEALAPNSPRAP